MFYNLRVDLIHNHAPQVDLIDGLLCCEYDSVYDSEYDSIYDQNFVYYDEESFDEELDGELYHNEDDSDDYDSDDLVLEEIPFVYCSERGEIGEA